MEVAVVLEEEEVEGADSEVEGVEVTEVEGVDSEAAVAEEGEEGEGKVQVCIRKITRIEPVGEPYREVCLSPWKGNWRMS